MLELSKTAQIMLALAMPASVIVAYWIYSQWSSDEDCYGMKKVATSHNTRIKVLVPRKAVGVVIGKQGSTIKWIQAETGARLNFNDRSVENDGKPRVLMITGTAETAQKAELMVYQVISEIPETLTEEIQVPHYCIGRIIGKGGVIIRDLRRASGVRIDIDKSHGYSGPDGKNPVTLTGSRQQIDVAIELIEEIVHKAEFEKHEETAGSNKENFIPIEKGSLKASAISVEEDDDHWDEFGQDGDIISMGTVNDIGPTPVMNTTHDGTGDVGSSLPLTEDYFQVMVSAVEHPGHFWVQAVGPTSLHLEQLQKDLTQQLAFETVRESLLVNDPQPGDQVAAKFEETDPIYYRAKVIGVTDDGQVDLYFIDYGDNVFAQMDKIFKLKPEFQHFPAQAIHCQLANVEPVDETVGWTEEALDQFEDLVHCAQWKPLYAKPLTYTRIEGQHEGQGDGEASSGLRPCLQLIDTASGKDVDIAKKLVDFGYARHAASTNRHKTS